jgi:hypothetical protein
MAERVTKSQKMAEPHAQACAALGVRHGTETCGDTAGVEHEWDRGHAQEAGRGGWVGRPAHRLVQPLGPGDGPMDPSR